MRNFWKVANSLQLDSTIGFSNKMKLMVDQLKEDQKIKLEDVSKLILSLHGAPKINLTVMFLEEVKEIDQNLAVRLDFEIAGMANVADTRNL